MPAPDVVIVGGGMIGASIAFHLAERGMQVMLLERGRAGGHASLASASMLHPQLEPEVPAALRDLGVASFALFPALVARLRDISGIDAQYQISGWLRVALEPASAPLLRARATEDAQRDYGLQFMDGREARDLEPALSPSVVFALYLPRGAQVYAPSLLTAYLQSAARLGASVRLGVEVRELLLGDHRVLGVRTADGESISAGYTVVAGGAWTPQLTDVLGLAAPVYPMRGQILALQAVPAPLRRVVFGPGAYLAPKMNGSLVVGATYEDAGFDDRLTAAGLSSLLLAAQTIVPALADATFRTAWVGLRPASRDGLPILGEVPGWEGVALATGHTAEGVLLSPISGLLLAQMIQGERGEISLAPFSPGRLML
jgi:glycine oxidase